MLLALIGGTQRVPAPRRAAGGRRGSSTPRPHRSGARSVLPEIPPAARACRTGPPARSGAYVRPGPGGGASSPRWRQIRPARDRPAVVGGGTRRRYLRRSRRRRTSVTGWPRRRAPRSADRRARDPAARPGVLALAARCGRPASPVAAATPGWRARPGPATGVRRRLAEEHRVARPDVPFRGYRRRAPPTPWPSLQPPLTPRAARPGTAGPRPARHRAGRSGRGGPRR